LYLDGLAETPTRPPLTYPEEFEHQVHLLDDGGDLRELAMSFSSSESTCVPLQVVVTHGNSLPIIFHAACVCGQCCTYTSAKKARSTAGWQKKAHLHDTASVCDNLHDRELADCLHLLPHQLRDKVGSVVILDAPQLHFPLEKDAPCGAEEEIDQMIMIHRFPAIREQGTTVFHGSLA